jgi:hypothetical protein
MSPAAFFLSAPAPVESALEASGAVAWFPSQHEAAAVLRARSLFGPSQAASVLLAPSGTQPPTAPPPAPAPAPAPPAPSFRVERVAIREAYHEARRRIADLLLRGLVTA